MKILDLESLTVIFAVTVNKAFIFQNVVLIFVMILCDIFFLDFVV